MVACCDSDGDDDAAAAADVSVSAGGVSDHIDEARTGEGVGNEATRLYRGG